MYIDGSTGGTAIVVDSLGNAYVTGSTNTTNFPITSGAVQAALGGTTDVFVTKVNAAGSALVYSSYLGGFQSASASGIALGASGSVYLTGAAWDGFPTTSGAYQTTFQYDPSNSSGIAPDIFVSKMTSQDVGLSPGSVTFSSQQVGTASLAHVVKLANSGSTTLNISSITLTGTISGDFAQTNNCDSSLAPNAICTITVTFTPAATGTRTATLEVQDDGANTPQTTGLTGTGVTTPASLAPSSLTFPGPDIGVSSEASVVSIK